MKEERERLSNWLWHEVDEEPWTVVGREKGKCWRSSTSWVARNGEEEEQEEGIAAHVSGACLT